MLDDGLDLMDALLRGGPVDHQGPISPARRQTPPELRAYVGEAPRSTSYRSRQIY